ncbi:hypothetical protein AbraIFM66950_003511 [Aspergillus brasiliensis]|nr:hypothetical protein AbraIFM66950_003511 [Aspergillus brasiliensis]
MADIYRCATSVVAWLGNIPNPDIEEAVAYNDASEGRITPRSKYWLDMGDPSTLTEHESQTRERAIVSVYFGSLEILAASYWKRLWAFQEWHLPSKEPLSYKFMRSRVQDMMGVKDKVGNDKLDDPKVQHRNETLLTTILERCTSWSSDWEFAHQHVPPELIRPDILRGDASEGQPFGLAPHVQQWLPPDYTKSTDQVILVTTAYMINIESVASAFQDFDFGQSKTFPSWALKLYDTEVPRSLGLTYNPFRHSELNKSIYNEAHVSDLLLAHWVSSNLSTLHLRGRPIGRVFGASQLPSDPVDSLHALSEIREHVLGLQREKGDLSGRFLYDIYNCTGDYLKEVPILVLEFVDLMMSRRAEDRHKLYANISNEMKKQVDQYDVLAGKWAIGIDSGIGLRTIGVAKGTDVQDRDLLIVPYGISQVLVIRDCPGEYQDKTTCHKIMGRAYVAGIAEDPEFQLTPLIEESEKVPFEQFYLR